MNRKILEQFFPNSLNLLICLAFLKCNQYTHGLGETYALFRGGGGNSLKLIATLVVANERCKESKCKAIHRELENRE